MSSDGQPLIPRIFCVFAVCAFFTAGAAYGQARDKPVGVGEVAPEFTLEDQNGQKHSLSAEHGKRPVVLIFYRGYW